MAVATGKRLQPLCLGDEWDTMWWWLRGSGYNSFAWERQDASGYNQQHFQRPWMLVDQDSRIDIGCSDYKGAVAISNPECRGPWKLPNLFALRVVAIEARRELSILWLRLWLQGSDYGFFLLGCGRTTSTADNVPDSSSCRSTRDPRTSILSCCGNQQS